MKRIITEVSEPPGENLFVCFYPDGHNLIFKTFQISLVGYSFHTILMP